MSKSIIETEFEVGIAKDVYNIDENCDDLNKLKYKDQFLQAIKETSQSKNNNDSVIKNKM